MIIQKILFLRLHDYFFTEDIHRIYYAALKMFKIFDSTTADSRDDEDAMDYLSLKVLSLKLIDTSSVKQRIV